MNTDATKLITQLVILATALVGLYKVIKFQPQQKASRQKTEQDKKKSGFISYFEPFFGLLAVLTFLLAFPVFVYLFSLITTSTTNLFDKKDTTKRNEVILEKEAEIAKKIAIRAEDLSVEQHKCYYLYMTALQVDFSKEKANLLTETVNDALEIGFYELAILAASQIEFSKRKDDTLFQIVNHAIERQNYDNAISALSLIDFSSNRYKAAELVFKKLEEELKKYQQTKTLPY